MARFICKIEATRKYKIVVLTPPNLHTTSTRNLEGLGCFKRKKPNFDNTCVFQMDLTSFLDKRQSECLNQSDDHPYAHCLTPGGDYLESDCDEQLILALTFNQAMKIHSLKIKAPSDKGPKTVRIFQNQPNTLDFDKADSMTSVQDLE